MPSNILPLTETFPWYGQSKNIRGHSSILQNSYFPIPLLTLSSGRYRTVSPCTSTDCLLGSSTRKLDFSFGTLSDRWLVRIVSIFLDSSSTFPVTPHIPGSGADNTLTLRPIHSCDLIVLGSIGIWLCYLLLCQRRNGGLVQRCQ